MFESELKELFSELLGTNISNPDLTEEQSWNAEAGININDDKIGLINVSLYYSNIHNMILNTALGNNKYQYQNIGKVTLSGIEVSYKKNTKFIDIDFNYAYLNSKNNTDNTSDKLEYRPEHSSNIILSKIYNTGFSWQMETFYTGRRFGIDGDTKEWVILADITTFNFRISQNIFNNIDLIFRINNIADKYYELEYGFPQQGRNIILGIKLNI